MIFYSCHHDVYKEGGIHMKKLKWDDPRANISWPIKNPILSVKDSLGYDPDFQEKADEK